MSTEHVPLRRANEPMSKTANEKRADRKGGSGGRGRAVPELIVDDAKSSRSGGKGGKKRAANAAKKSAKKSAKKKRAAEKKSARKAKRVFTAKTADRHELYQLAVQSPETDVDFLVKTFKKLRGRKPVHLREDFCGTGYLMAEWARRSPENTAEGYDIDPDPVEWGKARNFEGIEDPFARVHFHLEDVREPSRRAPEVRTAPNFSWMIFTDRATLLDYFRAVREDLADDGVYILDIYGGTEAAEEMEEIRKIPEGFEYVWDQVAYWPATGDYLCRIHFRFKDGTRIKKAFEYHWRLWNLPEVVDVLRDAGFSQVDSYWEGTDEDGVSGDGVFKKHAKGENCPAWVTYVVAQK